MMAKYNQLASELSPHMATTGDRTTCKRAAHVGIMAFKMSIYCLHLYLQLFSFQKQFGLRLPVPAEVAESQRLNQ